MNVIPFKQARARTRSVFTAHPRIEPPAALTRPLRAPQSVLDAEEAAEDRLRMRQNLAALLLIIAIVGTGTWLISTLQDHSRLQACIEAGHHNCLPLEAEYVAPPGWR